MVMDKIEAVFGDVVKIIKVHLEVPKNDRDLMKCSLSNVVDRLKQLELTPPFDTSFLEGTTNVKENAVGVYVDNFVDCFLLLLTHLGKELTNHESDKEESTLDTVIAGHATCLLQFVLKFGIVAYLELNISRKNTSNHSDLYNCFSLREKYLILHKNCCSLFTICHNKAIQKIVTERLLTDVIAAFMQLCFSPSSSRLLNINERKICLQNLNHIMENWISNGRLIEEILMLQGNLTDQIAPKWLQSKCGVILSRSLLKKGGVKTIITHMVSNFDTVEPGSNSGWEQVVALSSIISTLPSKGTTPEKYCELVCPQIIDLLVTARNQSEPEQVITRICVTSLHALHEKFPMDSVVFEQIICEPFYRCCCSFAGDNVFKNDVTGQQVTECMETLHQICVSVGVSPDSLLTMLIEPYFRLFFLIICDLEHTSSHLVSLSKDLIQYFLKKVNKEKGAILLLAMYGENAADKCESNKLKIPYKDMSFILTECGDINPVLKNCQAEPSDVLEKQDIKVNILLDILESVCQDSLVGDVFILLLKSLCDPEKNIPQQVNDNNIILAELDRASMAMQSNEVRFITFGLLTSMCEKFEPKVLLSDVSQIISFIKTVLEKLLTSLEPNEFNESLGTCLSVLGICLMSEMSLKEKKELNSVIPIMQKLRSQDSLNSHTKELISDLIIAISTYGAVNETAIDKFSKVMREQMEKFENLNLNNDKSVDTEKSTMQQAKPSTKSTTANEKKDSTKSDIDHDTGSKHHNLVDTDKKLSFAEAMEAVFDPCPALKGGSIRYLTKCIQQKLPNAIDNLEKLTEIFIECLNNDDSFVYLSAVQGVAVIANNAAHHLASEFLLDKIIDKFLRDNVQDRKTEEVCSTIETKMKLGEIIMRVIREMGDMGPHHATVILPVFLTGSRHPDPDMRASCLSSFAELAPMAPNYLTKIQYEISECICKIARCDEDHMVRRAAIHVVRQLIVKLRYKLLQVFPDTTKEFYRTLKFVYERDSDNVVQLHAQLALEELDEIMRNNIFQQPKLAKKITILPT